jgi:NADH-quinone oxidoreductase subunit J
MVISTILFYCFAMMILVSALCVVTSRNPVYGVLWLILAFFCTAGLFIIQGAEFLAMVLVIVYVGAIAVLFLFVVMMLNINIATRKGKFSKTLPLGIMIALILLLDLILAFKNSIINDGEDFISNASLPMVDQNELTNSHAIGSVLYTDFVLQFQIAGLILLLAMISSIVLAYTKNTKSKRQDIAKQVARDPKKAIKVVKIASRSGVDV